MLRSRIALATVLALATILGVTTFAQPSGAAPAGGSNPVGYLDFARVTNQTLSFGGWAADADSAGPVRVSIYVDGTVVSTVTANLPRPDVARVFPALGAQRGYSAAIAIGPGPHQVCAVALNVGPGGDAGLGCARVPALAVPSTAAPFGYLDSVSLRPGTLSVVGWATDPDTPTPTRINVTANGATFASLIANSVRTDVGRVYPSYGSVHGFRADIPWAPTPSNYSVCATAINIGPGANRLLGCRFLTVLPVGEPSELGTATATAAANDLQAQAVASRAATAATFPAGASSAARIAIAARALLQQAAGRRAVPPARPGIPAFVAASPTRLPDMQAVMGLKPSLGTFPAAKTGGRPGANRSFEFFRGDSLPSSPWPGAGLLGAAPVLPANGRTVSPTIPGYPAGYSPLRAEVALDTALAQLGEPYVWAASGPDSFDCSGLTQWAWAKAGVPLTHYTGSQAVQGVRVMPNQLLPGDLVLFGSDLHHVGMYLGAGYMIDAPYTGSYVRVNKIAWYGDFALAVRP